ncbi:hypothetical protein F4780DRAFT_793235 [Xylariomycetidae sp. FL0641]|nr:hypothetical protein F4780DRAFT_793235 [Xylariomycetidae sp. FL0641]
MPWTKSRATVVGITTVLFAILLAYVKSDTTASLGVILPPASSLARFVPSSLSPCPPPPSAAACPDPGYTTEIISLDPLLIYIRGFLGPSDIAGLLDAGAGSFAPSTVYRGGRLVRNPYRTSSSAALPPARAPAVRCVLARARRFLGAVLDPDPDPDAAGGDDEMGVPQLVQYTAGQQYNLHHDWLRVPQPAFDGSPRVFNRVASFFAVLRDNCSAGETWFPYRTGGGEAPGRPAWREHEDGGLAFAPVAGNAIFWVNLFPNGTGDPRTVHAGLPVTAGLKTALNIWPRQYRPAR